jgi:hypothetical protein
MISGENRNDRVPHVAARAARRRILEQHMELRRLLALGLVQTCMRSRDHQGELRRLVSALRKVFVEHISDEEIALRPLFEEDLLGGSRRLESLRQEHARQRRELDALHALSEAGSSAELADRFDGLARALLTEIAEEERALTLAVAALGERASRPSDFFQAAAVN